MFALILWIGIGCSAIRAARDFIRGRVGVDVIALCAMLVAALLHQWIAGSVILAMLLGGEALEAYASHRARRHLTHLLRGLPTIAHRRHGRGLQDVPVEQVAPHDILIVKPGESIPVDGVILTGSASVNESLLTGEPLPIYKNPHDHVIGGSINQDGLLEMHATHGAQESQYQRIVALVRAAEENHAPIVRLADQYSLLFTCVTFALAGLAWFISRDPTRALAVLVVATPCPLILATPIAILSGMSRAAKRGIIIRNGEAFELLARANVFLLDKTGTLTFGTPSIKEVLVFDTMQQDIVRIAASLDQGSSHVLARQLVAYAKKHRHKLAFPTHFKETIGKGVAGTLDHHTYLFGRLSFLHEHDCTIPAAIREEDSGRKNQGLRAVYLAEGKRLIGGIVFADTLRPNIKPFLHELTNSGVQHIELLTGDKQAVADTIGRKIGIDSIRAECLPKDKLRSVRAWQTKGFTVAMLGDGLNDAPALAGADVGIAMGANGSAAASDAADVIITVDNVSRVTEARLIAQQSMHVAKNGILIGIGLSCAMMVIAAAGCLSPVPGAIAQEAVDIIVIVHALRFSMKHA